MAFIGIDLGTTLSVVARPIGNVVEVLPNEEGNLLTPSVVYIPDGDLSQSIVGDAALGMLHSEERANVIRWVKRLMGTSQKIKIRRKDNTIVEFTPTEISGEILRKIKEDAERIMDEPIDGAVITVPAWFGLKQCEEVLLSAQLAGLKVLQIIPEPQAAAIDYSMDQSLNFDNKLVFVYDLGGGTFDATLISVSRNFYGNSTPSIIFEEIAKEGSRELGGYDWDKQLLKYCCEIFDQKYDTDSCLESTEDLELEAERVKKLLTKLPQAEFNISVGDIQDSIPVTREKFEEITSALLEETRTKIRQTLRKAGKSWDEISYIVMVGGSSQMQMIGRMLEEEVGQENIYKICRHKGVSFNVARGAAYVAGDFVKIEKKIPPVHTESVQVSPNQSNLLPSIPKKSFTTPKGIPIQISNLIPKKPKSNLFESVRKNITSKKELELPTITPTPIPMPTSTPTSVEDDEGIVIYPALDEKNRDEFVQLSNIVVRRRLKEQDAIGVTGIRKGLAMNAIILPAGSYTDEEHTRIFPLADPDMTEIIIVINRGAEEDLEKVEQDKGRLILQSLPPGRPAGCLVEIRMKLDKNGMLSVKAKDMETNQDCNTLIQLDPISQQ